MKTVLALTNHLEHVPAWSGELAGDTLITMTPDLPAALAFLAEEQPDLIVVDLASLGDAGFDLGRRLRSRTTVPILAVVGQIREAEQAVTVDRIADDFFLADGTLRELAARARALVERRATALRPNPLRLGDLTISEGDRSVSVAGEPVDLTATELELLTALAADPGRVQTRAELVRALAPRGSISERTVDSHVKNLRAKIEPDPHHPRYLITVHGLGYRLNPSPHPAYPADLPDSYTRSP